MDIKPAPCSRCGYLLPMTWTDPAELMETMTAAGWLITKDRTLCPTCRRVEIWQSSTSISVMVAAFGS